MNKHSFYVYMIDPIEKHLIKQKLADKTIVVHE